MVSMSFFWLKVRVNKFSLLEWELSFLDINSATGSC